MPGRIFKYGSCRPALRLTSLPLPRSATLTGYVLVMLLVGWTLPAWPQGVAAQAYAVEIIIFRASSIAGVTEDWSAAPMPRGFGSDPARASSGPQVLKLLGADEYRLTGVESALRSSGAWRPLAHVAWTQTAANWGTHLGLSLG